MLKALAANGFLRRSGSWDLPVRPGTVVELTALGHQLAGHLEQLQRWAQQQADDRAKAAATADRRALP
jgi:DNA-binding HxlR family transcriptional regulator